MNGTLEGAIVELQARMRQIVGVRVAPQAAPDQVSMFPAVIAYPWRGVWTMNDATFTTALHTIVLEVHIARKSLERDIPRVVPFGEAVAMSIISGLVQSTYTNFQTFGRITYEFGPMKWDATNTIGYRFFVEDLKIQTAVT